MKQFNLFYKDSYKICISLKYTSYDVLTNWISILMVQHTLFRNTAPNIQIEILFNLCSF